MPTVLRLGTVVVLTMRLGTVVFLSFGVERALRLLRTGRVKGGFVVRVAAGVLAFFAVVVSARRGGLVETVLRGGSVRAGNFFAVVPRV